MARGTFCHCQVYRRRLTRISEPVDGLIERVVMRQDTLYDCWTAYPWRDGSLTHREKPEKNSFYIVKMLCSIYSHHLQVLRRWYFYDNSLRQLVIGL